jgi:hypothetical protein
MLHVLIPLGLLLVPMLVVVVAAAAVLLAAVRVKVVHSYR